MPESLGNYLSLLLVVAALIIVIMLGRRRGRTRAAGKGDGEGAQDARVRLRKSMEELQIKLMEFGRDMEGRLDTRIRTLSELIREADERIARLEELKGGKGRTSGDEVPELHREIHRLADEGLDNVEIARRTSSTPGEVELILGLRRQRGEGGAS
ncbi:MAG: hypothetical protein ACYTAN_03880 [Planctomycetota bacterium]|jgi:hypothetical protein